MRRLRNYYCWETIEDWLKAQKCGLVNLQEIKIHKDTEERELCLKKLLEMAECDCFPMAVVCLKKEESYFLILDSLLYHMFRFLNNNVSIEGEEGKYIFFDDLEDNRKSSILKSQIHSVWIDM